MLADSVIACLPPTEAAAAALLGFGRDRGVEALLPRIAGVGRKHAHVLRLLDRCLGLLLRPAAPPPALTVLRRDQLFGGRRQLRLGLVVRLDGALVRRELGGG